VNVRRQRSTRTADRTASDSAVQPHRWRRYERNLDSEGIPDSDGAPGHSVRDMTKRLRAHGRRAIREVRRRRVHTVALAYGGLGWLVVEISATVAPLLSLPGWVPTLVLLLVLLGFPFALILSWLFDVTTEGVRRTSSEFAATPAWPQAGARGWTPQRIATVGGFMVLALASASFLILRNGSTPRETVGTASTVVVFPFAVRAGGNVAFLREAMVEILSTDLESSGRLQAVDPNRVLGIEGWRRDFLSPEDGRTMAAELGAGLFVLGSVLEMEGHVRLTASLYDRSRGARPLATRMVQGRVDEVVSMASRLGALLAAALPTEAGSSRHSVRLIWSHTTLDDFSSLSPDARHVSFVDWTTGDLAIHDVAAGTDRRLTSKGSWGESDEFALHSVFSPDGSTLAYAWSTSEGAYELRLIATDGSGHRTLLKQAFGRESHRPYGWSPDSRRVLVLLAKGEEPAALAWIGPVEGVVDTILQIPITVGAVASSPDGNWIAYDSPTVPDRPERDIVLVDSRGRTRGRIATPADETVVAWTLGSDGLLILSDRDGVNSLYLQPVADGRPVGEPVLLRANTPHLAAMRVTAGNLYYRVPGSEKQSYVVDVDLAEARLIGDPELVSHPSALSSSWPSWAPDGRSVAYLVHGSNPHPDRSVVAIRNLESGQLREYGLQLAAISLHWWANPTGLLVRGTRQNVYGTFRLNLDSGETTPFPWVDVVAPDGRTAFIRHELSAEQIEIIRRDQFGDTSRAVIYRGGALRITAVSPDGSRLLLRLFDNTRTGTLAEQLAFIPSGGGQPRVIRQFTDTATYGGSWSADQRYIVYVTFQPSGGERAVKRLRLQDGDERTIFSHSSLNNVRLSPDGRRLAFSSGSARGELWVIEGLLGQ
jgi:Tol biopolymer transport system component/TolB-like protein